MEILKFHPFEFREWFIQRDIVLDQRFSIWGYRSNFPEVADVFLSISIESCCVCMFCFCLPSTYK